MRPITHLNEADPQTKEHAPESSHVLSSNATMRSIGAVRTPALRETAGNTGTRKCLKINVPTVFVSFQSFSASVSLVAFVAWRVVL